MKEADNGEDLMRQDRSPGQCHCYDKGVDDALGTEVIDSYNHCLGSGGNPNAHTLTSAENRKI